MGNVYDISRARPCPSAVDRIGVPTLYKDVRFRSRLEARWAATFERLRWSWSYEPYDLSGYLPDFIIDFKRSQLLVEVKPATEFEKLASAARKVCRSGWRADFLIVGGRLFSPESSQATSFGLFGKWDRDTEDGWLPGDHAIAHRCATCARVTFHHHSDAWSCVSCGSQIERPAIADAEVRQAWVESGNDVQWRGRKSDA